MDVNERLSQFFQKRGVAEAMNAYELFNAVSGLNIPVEVEDEAEFISEVNASLFHRWGDAGPTCGSQQIMVLEKRNEDHVQRRGKKTFPVESGDGGPPLNPGVDD